MGAADWDAYIDAVAPAVGLTLDPGWRPGVARFLALAAGMAARLEAVELGGRPRSSSTRCWSSPEPP